MRRPCRTLFLVSIAFALGACAEDLGTELQALSARDSKIVFQAPGLQSKTARYMRNYNARQSLRIEQAVWLGPEARHAKALVQYIEASPGYYLRRATDIEDLLGYINDFEGKSLDVGPQAWALNDLGRIRYRDFSFDDVNCVVFGQLMGATGSDLAGGGAGDHELVGYYCADPGQAFDGAARDKVLTSIDLRK